jgi:hypothetical protein
MDCTLHVESWLKEPLEITAICAEEACAGVIKWCLKPSIHHALIHAYMHTLLAYMLYIIHAYYTHTLIHHTLQHTRHHTPSTPTPHCIIHYTTHHTPCTMHHTPYAIPHALIHLCGGDVCWGYNNFPC